jgi:preprotein translocase subunit SecB
MAENEQDNRNEGEEKIIQTKKIYLKDVSFETPNSPQVFTLEWKPELSVELNKQTAQLSDDHYEVVMVLTIVVKVAKKTAYLAEVHQGGIFQLKGLDSEALQKAQHVYCLAALYPYACAAVWDLVNKGGFPQLNLAPMNFNLLYRHNLKAIQEQASASETQQH